MASLRDLKRDLEGFKRDLRRVAVPRANARVADGAKAVAKAYSSGSVKSIALQTPMGVTHHMNPITGKVTKLQARRHGSARGFGAPYGHGGHGWLGPRGPIPYGDAGWINKQSGEFYRSWHVFRGSSRNGWPRLILQNTAPHAKFLDEGTGLMIRRPIEERIQDYIDKVSPALFKTEFDLVWRVRFNTK